MQLYDAFCKSFSFLKRGANFHPIWESVKQKKNER